MDSITLHVIILIGFRTFVVYRKNGFKDMTQLLYMNIIIIKVFKVVT